MYSRYGKASYRVFYVLHQVKVPQFLKNGNTLVGNSCIT